MAIFSKKTSQEILVPDVKTPIIEVLEELMEGGLNLSTIRKLHRAKKGLSKLPYPTEENVSRPLSKVLVRMRDRFLRCEQQPSRKKFWDNVWSLAIIVIDKCAYYAYRGQIIAEFIAESLEKDEWPRRRKYGPTYFWDESQNKEET